MKPLRAFTFRGRVLLCVGVAVAVGAVLVGERDLLRVGVFVVSLPLLAALTVLRVPDGVRHTRDLLPARVTAGEEARVVIRLTGSSTALFAGGLVVEETLPLALGRPPSFAVGRLRRGEEREIAYRVCARARGRYPIGPLTLRFRDPLGCVELARPSGSGLSLLVVPRIVELSGAAPGGGTADSDTSPARSMASSGEDDTVPREYRHGDDVRRVHWRSTARRGELMVRREERWRREQATLLLDARSHAHAGEGAESSLETAVAAAGSIALHLSADGREIRLLAAGGETTVSGHGVLDVLAVLPASTSDLRCELGLLDESVAADRGPVVAVLGALTESDLDEFARTRPAQGRDRIAVLCRRAPWSSPALLEKAQVRLTGTGWRVLAIDTLDDLPAAWQGRRPSTERTGPLGGHR
ncbi:DUF58 domain-containing protein [Marinactinospora thermotolerans]|uniref:Uncharacterized conserved protein, DUF58 family, contains vWF domain n=1 Tax=Marinactinospora thermotolerans DSM 45154 TaxID=1122192 RepID=A0A1T4KWE5_9ACTN|nr:DUF58 domain-containing protein [Marinactinospora thermotolerans]SJZ46754.1 Uncharacterized conserved protein, DUF58 family, contains vWF domain [Marinactinospora thermotolerans DSM 45154]